MEYDQLFKNLLEAFFKPFIELFFPEVAVRLDWREIEFLREEKFTDIPAGLSRFVDLVAKVATKEGEPELILVHVDVEHPWRSTFPFRMFEYYALLRLRHRLPVFPIAILPERQVKGFEPETYSEETITNRGLRSNLNVFFCRFHVRIPSTKTIPPVIVENLCSDLK